jgi:hypothetical protein
MAKSPTDESEAPVVGGLPTPPTAGQKRPALVKGALAHLLAKPVTGEATVTVACKHPAGFRLMDYDWADEYEPVMGGGTRLVKVARQNGKEVFIKGCGLAMNEAPRAQMSGGYALTEGVSKAFWDKFTRDYAEWGPIKAGLIFAHENKQRVIDAAAANVERLSGHERLDADAEGKKYGLVRDTAAA